MVFFNHKRRKFHISFTFLLILLNAIFFIFFNILVNLKLFSIDYLALNPSNIFSGSFFWTFLTSIFMHASFFHLIVNMISLIFVGSLVEKLIGKWRYLSIYLLSGIFAGFVFILSSLIFKSDFVKNAVGASGAIFGLIGVLMVLTPNLSVYLMFIPIPIKMKYSGPILLALLWLVSVLGNVPLGNFAHLGGFIFGLAYGFYLKHKFPNKVKYISNYFS